VRKLADVLENAERTDGAGDEDFLFCGFASFAGNFDGAMIELSNAIAHAELRKLVAIGAEGIGFDDLRAGFDVDLMNVKDGFGMGDVELVSAALRADRFIEQGTHGAVGDQDHLAQAFIEIFNAHGLVLFAGNAPGDETNPASGYFGSGQKVRNYTIGCAGDSKRPRGGGRRGDWGSRRARQRKSENRIVRASTQKYRIEMGALLCFQWFASFLIFPGWLICID